MPPSDDYDVDEDRIRYLSIVPYIEKFALFSPRYTCKDRSGGSTKINLIIEISSTLFSKHFQFGLTQV